MSHQLPGYLLVARAGADEKHQQGMEAATAVLAEAGPVEVTRSHDEGDLDRLGEMADGRTIVICGGDGSLHLAINRLFAGGALEDLSFGLIPLGTGNDFARGVGIPLDPAEAAAALVTGRPRRFDLLVDDDGAVVVNAVHIGLGARASSVASGMKESLGALAYPLGALIAGVREGGWRLDITVDGQAVATPSDGPCLMVGVANGASIGGGTRLCPQADPGDGLADVVVVAATGPAARVAFGAALLRGRHLERGDVVHSRGRSITLSGEPAPVNADGELSGEASGRTYALQPACWSLIAPPEPEAS